MRSLIKKNHTKKPCEICHKIHFEEELFPIAMLRQSLLEKIKKNYPDISIEGMICPEDLKQMRNATIEDLIMEDKGELTKLDMEVLKSFEEHEILAENLNEKYEKVLDLGERLSDKIAKFGGSWKFISIFLGIIFFWMGVNVLQVLKTPFDPYPFILLNLFLSCLAALQAPIIMMSQNRQAQRDRLKADYEYTTNLKAELEIRQLHAKIDQLMKKHWSRLLEIQQVQIDIVEELLDINKNKR